jgi:hypothetical protein
MKMLQEEGFLKEDSWRFIKGETVLAPRLDERVMTKAWVDDVVRLKAICFQHLREEVRGRK